MAVPGNINSAGTKYYKFGGITLDSGQFLGPITLAYETYGRLNPQKTNVILIEHAFSGDAHAGGPGGWWQEMIGPGKAFDTDHYYVICSNVIGGCQGSTGPSSLDPQTGKPYAVDFPLITIADMVRAQKELIDHLGVHRLLAVAGGSMGGMLALQWVSSYPQIVKSAIPIATTLKHSPQQIAFNEVGRQAIMADPAWNGGAYYGREKPERGLAVARMIGHITYMSDKSMEEKFSRRLKDNGPNFKFSNDFEVEGYLKYKGDSFVKRFDANSYLYLSKAIDHFDLADNRSLPGNSEAAIRFLILAFSSDWLYPLYQSQEMVRHLRRKQADVTSLEIKSSYGHDAFLLEVEEQTRVIRSFIDKTYHGYRVVDEYEI
ncbi:MAG: homoserine O-acetyltransferase [Candidatus Margulisbacteria bacterium]|jgi:homoserine O-acetyltransferase|nr:homoserine O-acetyltransferase [Candidatus Margulisiibacteriota bacterium]